MSNLWLNLRILCWHLQIGPGFPWISFGINPFWWGWHVWRTPIALYEFRLRR